MEGLTIVQVYISNLQEKKEYGLYVYNPNEWTFDEFRGFMNTIYESNETQDKIDEKLSRLGIERIFIHENMTIG